MVNLFLIQYNAKGSEKIGNSTVASWLKMPSALNKM